MSKFFQESVARMIGPNSYWGMPISDPGSGTQSPTFGRLLEAIFRHYKNAQGNPPLSGLVPSSFHKLTRQFPFVTGLACFSAEAPKGLEEKNALVFSYALTMAYYKAMGMEFTTGTNVHGDVVPILQVSGVCRWILLQLWTQPSETADCLTAMMETLEPALVDEYDTPFYHSKIPAICLPYMHPAAASTMANMQENWLMSRSCVLSAAKAEMTTEEIGAVNRQMIQNTQMRAQQPGQWGVNTAQNTQMMTFSSAGASLAAYSSLNVGWNVMKQGSGNF